MDTYTRQDLREQVRDLLDDDEDGPNLSNGKLNRWLGKAYNYVASKYPWPFAVKTLTASVPSGTSSVALPDSAVSVEYVMLNGTDKLTFIDRTAWVGMQASVSQDFGAQPGGALAYTVDGWPPIVKFYPAPADDCTVTIVYNDSPGLPRDDDAQIALPSDFADLLVLRTAYFAAMARRDGQMMQLFKAEYQEQLRQAKITLGPRTQDQYVIGISQPMWSNGW